MIRFLLPVSLFANVALAAVVVFKAPRRPTSDDASALPSTQHHADTGTPPAAGAPGALASQGGRESSPAGVLNWDNLPTGDLPRLVERLRAAGFPPKAIRAVLSGLLGQQWVARRRELTAEQDEQPFWKAQPFMRPPKITAEINQLGRQHAALLRELLGPDAEDDLTEEALWHRRRFGNLPPDKLRRVNEIASDYNNMLNEVRSQRILLTEDRERIAYLEKERLADLAKVLTPAELEELEMRSSNLGSETRWLTAAFEPTREEFQAIYQANVAARQKLGEVDNGWISLGNTSSERQKLALEQLQTSLTPARLAEFKLATDPQYRQTALLVQRLQLPVSVTQEVVAIQDDITTRSRTVREDKSLKPEEQKAQLAALAQEASTKLSEKLGGPRGLDAYEQNGGQWLQRLSPQRP